MNSEDEDIRQYSLDELRQLRAAHGSETRSDAPEYPLDEQFWANARLVLPPSKTSVHLRVDSDVLEWFREQGRGHLTRMNAVLRSYMDAHKTR